MMLPMAAIIYLCIDLFRSEYQNMHIYTINRSLVLPKVFFVFSIKREFYLPTVTLCFLIGDHQTVGVFALIIYGL